MRSRVYEYGWRNFATYLSLALMGNMVIAGTTLGMPESESCFDGESFNLKKLADIDAAGSDPIPLSAKVWMLITTLFNDERTDKDQMDRGLLNGIKADQERGYVKIQKIWQLFENRVRSGRYSDARSCLNLAEVLLKNESTFSPSVVALRTNHLLLDKLSLGQPVAELRHGHVQLSDTATAAVNKPSVSLPAQNSHSWTLVRGYTGVRIIDGKIDYCDKYSPAYKQGGLREGDEVISVNNVPIAELSTKEYTRLAAGVAGQLTHIVYTRRGIEHAVDIMSDKHPSERSADGLASAKDKYELGCQQREVGYMEGAKASFKQAVAVDPGGEYGIFAAQALRSRMTLFEPNARCLGIYMRAYYGNFDHEEVKAEALFRYVIAEWPKFEWPYRQLAKLLVDEKRYDEAENVITSLLKINPDYARGWIVLYTIRKEQGYKSEALKCWRKAHELDPDDIDAPHTRSGRLL